MSAKLPRLMVYSNAIRGRIRNRSIDLHPAHAEPMQAWTDLTTKTEQP